MSNDELLESLKNDMKKYESLRSGVKGYEEEFIYACNCAIRIEDEGVVPHMIDPVFHSLKVKCKDKIKFVGDYKFEVKIYKFTSKNDEELR
jgi:hypothetical protein